MSELWNVQSFSCSMRTNHSGFENGKNGKKGPKQRNNPEGKKDKGRHSPWSLRKEGRLMLHNRCFKVYLSIFTAKNEI